MICTVSSFFQPLQAKTLPAADEPIVHEMAQYARKLVGTRVKIVVDPGQASLIAEAIRDSPLHGLQTKPLQYIPVFYDMKLAG